MTVNDATAGRYIAVTLSFPPFSAKQDGDIHSNILLKRSIPYQYCICVFQIRTCIICTCMSVLYVCGHVGISAVSQFLDMKHKNMMRKFMKSSFDDPCIFMCCTLLSHFTFLLCMDVCLHQSPAVTQRSFLMS